MHLVSFQEAEKFDRRLFGSPNNAVRPQNEQEGEGQEQNAEERNAASANDNQEDNPEVLATGAYVNDNTTLATQNEPVSSNALDSISKKTEIEHGGERNAAHAHDNQNDNPEVLATGANVGDNTTLAIQREPVSSTALNSTSKKTEEEHGKGIKAAHAHDNQEDNPEVLATSALNVGDNTTLATQNEPVSSITLKSSSKKTNEEHGEGRNPAHAKNKLVLASGAGIDLKSTETA